jgi:hypothetical protein
MTKKQEPVYLIKSSELQKLVDKKTPIDRLSICTEVIERGNVMEMWDSTAIIGDSHKIFDIRKEHDPYKDHVPGYELQWRSFYDGWGEGRINMLGKFFDLLKR